MDATARAELIQRYRNGYNEVIAALNRLSESDLDLAPSGGGWTARMVVHHLADSEMTSAIRLRRLIAEESPAIVAFDEELYARSLFYDTRPIEASLAAFKAARETSASLLELLSESQWQRSGSHSQSGAYSVETWLGIYAAHGHDHAEQILQAAGKV